MIFIWIYYISFYLSMTLCVKVFVGGWVSTSREAFYLPATKIKSYFLEYIGGYKIPKLILNRKIILSCI